MSISDLEGHPNVPKEYHPEARVEPVPKANFPHQHYPRWIGHKFDPSGSVLEYPGNTVLAHLHPGSSFHQALRTLHEDLKAQDFAPLFTFLPPSSWHMTISEGITDQIRRRDSYPGDLSLDTSLNVCHAHVASCLADFKHLLGARGVGRMTIVGFEPLEDGIGLTLKPSSADQGRDLRQLRDQLSQKLKMQHPGHATYSWHMGLAYTLQHLTPDQKAKIRTYLETWLRQEPRSFELRLPELCVYDNMYQFRRMFFLG